MLILLAAPALGAPPVVPVPASPEREAPRVEELRERLRALEEAPETDEALRNRLLGYYRDALARLEAARRYTETAAEYRNALDQAPTSTAALAGEVEIPPVDPNDYRDAPLEALKEALVREKGTLAALSSQLADTQERLRALEGRPNRARAELDAAKQQRTVVETALEQSVPEGEDPRLADARQAALLAQRLALDRQISMLEQELLSHDARLALIQAQDSVLQRQVAAQQERLGAIQGLANSASRAQAAEAADTAAQATEALAADYPPLAEAAATNAKLSAQLAELVSEIEGASTRQRDTAQTLERIQESYHNTRQQLEVAGLSDALGELLRRERRALPQAYELAARAAERREQMAQASLRQMQILQESRALGSADARAARLLAALPAELPEATREALRRQFTLLLGDRVALEEKLAINYGRYVDLLADLIRDEELLLLQLEQYRELLDQNLFWIASAPPFGLRSAGDLGAALAWLLNPTAWGETAAAALETVAAAPLPPLTALLGLLLFVRVRPRLRESLRECGEFTRGPGDRYAATLRALLLTLLLALPLPAVLALLAWLLMAPVDSSPFPEGVGRGLAAAAGVVLALESFRQLCRRDGVAQRHFNWPPRSARLLRRNLTWLIGVSVPLAMVITLTEWQPDDLYRNSLGRLAFVLGSLAMALFAWRTLHPHRGVWRGVTNQRSLRWARRLFPLAVAAPLLLAVLALAGYYYTALQLESRLFSTGGLLVATVVLLGLILRWIRLAEQHLAAQRQALQRECGAVESGPGVSRHTGPDLSTVDSHTRALLRVVLGLALAAGLLVIWADLLPALNLLDEIVLWQQLGEDGELVISVTLVDLLTALALVAVTAVAARNLPGVLEITVLSRLPLDAGNRYAITTISRYLIVAVGLLAALALAGVSWGKAQWLVAALGVGLGFGLQEIFANFVSGLILLFERPIRIGDTVTVGEMTGQVTRIRIRATTITDWDQRELIIPNKTFITERLINWTLSSDVTRVVLSVDVAYGSDPEQVSALVRELAHDNPRVLKEPEPLVYFREIGPSALRFELHVYVATLSDRIPVRHELLSAIQAGFAAAGLRIPYPQSEVHLHRAPASSPGPSA